MEHIQVDTERETPPEWAKAQQTGVLPDKITPKQRDYLLSLIERKHVTEDQQGTLDQVMKALRISEDPEEFGMGKKQASTLIEWFKDRPDKPASQRARKTGHDGIMEWHLVPAGRYAVDNTQGELRFYQVWRPKDNDRIFRLYVLHGEDSSKVEGNAVPAIMGKIVADVRAAAIRYGLEIGSCSNCGRRLTNRISRELGIGPVCGGRMFGDDFSDMVITKRNELILKGLDPDEEMSDAQA